MTPNAEKYRMPAEWEPHSCTFLSWPVRESMCFPEQYEEVCRGYESFVRAVSAFEPVKVLVNPEEYAQLRTRLEGPAVECLPIAHNDSWVRDNGPTFVRDEAGNLAGVNWKFNAWGGKYTPWDLDDAVASMVLERFSVPRLDAPLVLEGGSIHTDGEGTFLTTEQCLLNPNRNPHLSRKEIAGYLGKYAGAEKIIWLKRGLSGDETDGHVDNIACFAAPGKILLQVCDDPADENAEITRENLAILRDAVDAKGRKLTVIPVKQPPRRKANGVRLTLSYLNFYLVNGGVILPVFGGDAAAADRLAVAAIGGAFPGRKVKTIDGMAIIREGGNVHCATQQMPLENDDPNKRREVGCEK